MSTTTNNAPKPAIIAASTTNDVIRAMCDDQALRGAVLAAFNMVLTSKGALSSRTLWVAVLGPVVAALLAHFGVPSDAELPVDIASTIFGAVMFGLRLVTKAPVAGIVMTPTTQGTTP